MAEQLSEALTQNTIMITVTLITITALVLGTIAVFPRKKPQMRPIKVRVKK